MLRHLRSLRRMNRDHGWIHTLLEEAENERMHLLTFVQLKQPVGRLSWCVVRNAPAQNLTMDMVAEHGVPDFGDDDAGSVHELLLFHLPDQPKDLPPIRRLTRGGGGQDLH